VNHVCRYSGDVVENCCDADADCSDGDPCTIDGCGEGNLCLASVAISVPDGGICCDDHLDCLDDDLSAIEYCDLSAQLCQSVPNPDYCDSADDACDDANACTEDSCNPWIFSCVHALTEDCCVSDADCPEGDDICTPLVGCDPDSNTCTYDAIEGCCTADGDCDDETPCTLDGCTGNVCAHDDEPCCDGDGECNALEYCASNQLCKDKKPDGDPCDGDNQCLGGNCSGGICGGVDCGVDTAVISTEAEALLYQSCASLNNVEIKGPEVKAVTLTAEIILGTLKIKGTELLTEVHIFAKEIVEHVQVAQNQLLAFLEFGQLREIHGAMIVVENPRLAVMLTPELVKIDSFLEITKNEMLCIDPTVDWGAIVGSPSISDNGDCCASDTDCAPYTPTCGSVFCVGDGFNRGCAIFPTNCPGMCCYESPTPGCSLGDDVAACVCAIRPECCSDSWNMDCIHVATEACGEICSW